MSEREEERITLWRSRAYWYRLIEAALALGIMVALLQALHGEVPWIVRE